MKLSHSLVLTLPLVSGWAVAADLSVKFDLPQLNVAEYHKPYVAIWLERADQSVAANLAVLYDLKKDAAGEKWVKDLRTWWRKAGRDAKFPLEAVTAFREAKNEDDRRQAAARVRADMARHVGDIAQKYLLPGETQDMALMFVPSESVYAELYDGFDDIVQKAYRAKVVIVSPSLPTTLTMSPSRTVSKNHSASAVLMPVQPWLTLALP